MPLLLRLVNALLLVLPPDLLLSGLPESTLDEPLGRVRVDPDPLGVILDLL